MGTVGQVEAKKKGYQHWCTPPEVVELVHRFFGGPPDLDPWTNTHSAVGARVGFLGENPSVYPPFSHMVGGCHMVLRDGFQPWLEEPGRVALKYATIFGNPPWKQTQKAIRHMRDEWVRVPGRQVIGLVPTGPNCSAWPLVLRAPAVCFPAKRLVFWREGAPAPTGGDKDTCLPYWGHDPYRWREVFRELGEVVLG